MNKIIIIADKVMPDSKLIGLINAHFPEQEIVVIRREDIGHDQRHPNGDSVWSGGPAVKNQSAAVEFSPAATGRWVHEKTDQNHAHRL